MNDDEFLAEFEWTRCRHHGNVMAAASIFDMKPESLARRLARAKAKGYTGYFTTRGIDK